MEIEYGAEVIDRNGKVVGSVQYLMRNSWTGEISKFMVHSEKAGHLFFSPQDVLQVTKRNIKLNVSFGEVGEKG